MSGVQMVSVIVGDDGMRLDRWFRQHFPQVRHGELEKMLRKGQVRVDGGRVKANRRLVMGESIRVPPVRDKRDDKPTQTRPLSREDREFMRELVIYEDHHLIALNKPFGLAVQGGAKTNRHIDGMLEALTADTKASKSGAVERGERPRLVHRLDRDTGGLLLLGKSRKSTALLADFFKTQKIKKEYWALCAGLPSPRQGTINFSIAKKMIRVREEDQERMVAAEGEDAKRAITDYQIIDEAGGTASFVALRPRTGRTHQLRVHCVAMGTPIIGDGKYGGPAARLEGVASKMHLFCRAMTLPNIAGGPPITLRANLTGHMRETWKFFNFDANAEFDWPELD